MARVIDTDPAGAPTAAQNPYQSGTLEWEAFEENRNGGYNPYVEGTAEWKDWNTRHPQAAAPTAPVDRSNDLGIPGLPSEVAAQVNQIFATTPDVTEAAMLALAYIRGTDWYKATYKGIASGISKGLFADERGYRAYLNDANQVYRNYYGRDITSAEMESYLNEGIDPKVIGQRAEGDVIAKTNAPEWGYLSGAFDSGQFSDTEKQALGREQAGIDSPLGQAVMKRMALATQRMQAVFSGTSGTPGFGLGAQGLQANSLAPRGDSDVAA